MVVVTAENAAHDQMPHSQLRTLTAITAMPVPAATPANVFFAPWLAVSELIAADHDGDQAGDLGNSSGEEVLESGESRVERRAARLGKRDRRDNDNQS